MTLHLSWGDVAFALTLCALCTVPWVVQAARLFGPDPEHRKHDRDPFYGGGD
jgi:hypothetical protein